MPVPEIKITECPRDAMQGLINFVPTAVKAAYINLLLKVGFDRIDFGSFVSARAIPQMQDTAEVLDLLDMGNTSSELLAIIANYRGAEDATQFPQVKFLGFPLSVSETFQHRNTNASISEAFDTVQRVNELCTRSNKELLVYLSMGFGNPYGDEYNQDIVLKWADELVKAGVRHIALADTIGVATPAQIRNLYPALNNEFPQASIGLHLHSTPDSYKEKIEAAYQSGCTRFDTALKGYGGCPMAKDELTGNIATEKVLAYLQNQNASLGINFDRLNEAIGYSGKVFG